MDKKDYGDFQTPWLLADAICSILEKDFALGGFTSIIEPTCGTGNFLFAAACHWGSSCRDIIGIELNPEYCIETEKFQKRFNRLSVIHANIFGLPTKPYLMNPAKVLIIGNPPWADISGIHENHPMKKAQENLKGLENLTGASNIDIGWFIIMQLAREYQKSDTTIAMLCKTSAARKVFLSLVEENIPFKSFDIMEIEAKDWFSVEVHGSLMVARLSDTEESANTMTYTDMGGNKKIFYAQHGLIVEDGKYLGKCSMEWRQGVKHDLKNVMEFSVIEHGLLNGLGESAELEEGLLFPLANSVSLKHPIVFDYDKKILITQRKLNEDTSYIEKEFPFTWRYLYKHRTQFLGRKSSIYRNTPDFSLFGIGAYSFSPYKVAIYGFRKKPFFSLLMPENGKPAMIGDTSYFLPFDDYGKALVVMLLLNSKKVTDFLSTLAFPDSKRPFTKKILSKIDFSKIMQDVSFEELQKLKEEFDIQGSLEISDYEAVKKIAAL